MISRFKKKTTITSRFYVNFIFCGVLPFILVLCSQWFYPATIHLGKWFVPSVVAYVLILNAALTQLSFEMVFAAEENQFDLTKRYLLWKCVCYARRYPNISSIYWKEAFSHECSSDDTPELLVTFPDKSTKRVINFIDLVTFDLSRSDIITFRDDAHDKLIKAKYGNEDD